MVVINGNYRELTLDNGLVIALQNTPTGTVFSRLRVHHGSSHEDGDERGLSHFLEHCLIDGGAETLLPSEIKKIKGSWGYHNASTGVRATVFEAELLQEDVGDWLRVVSKGIFFPEFDNGVVEQERQRVLREIEMRRADPHYASWQSFKSAMCRGHPVGRDTVGETKIIHVASVDALRVLHGRGYGASNMDLVLVGDLPDDIDERVTDCFGRGPSGSNNRLQFPILSPLDSMKFLHSKMPQTTGEGGAQAAIALGLIGIPQTHKDDYAIQILFRVLGGSSNSRLHERMSSREGLTYDVSTTYTSEHNAPFSVTQTSVPAGKWDEAVDMMFEEMHKLRSDGATERELEGVKKRMRFNVARAIQTNQDHISTIYEKWETGRDLNDFLDGYDSVTLNDITRVARKYLPEGRKNGRYVLSVRDPLKED